MKRIIIISVLAISVQLGNAQNIDIGVIGGTYSYGFSTPVDMMLGISAEYSPSKALFLLGTDIQYLFKQKFLLAPLTLNLAYGNIIKPRIFGGIVPVFRVKPVEPNVVFGVGAKAGFGLDIKVVEKISSSVQMGWYFIPERSYHYNHFSSPDIDKYMDRYLNFTISIKYQI